MCYSAESSINTYFISLFFTIILFLIGGKFDKNVAIFCFVFVQMQLAEYFMWKDQDCGWLNNLGTRFGHFVLMLEPISIIVGALIYQTMIVPNSILYLSLAILMVPLIEITYSNFTNTKYLCSRETEEETGKLHWEFTNGDVSNWPFHHWVIYGFFMFVPWLFFKNRNKGLFIFLLGFGSYAYSKFNFTNWETMWCFIATILPAILVISKLLGY